jgi:hypothetical protein
MLAATGLNVGQEKAAKKVLEKIESRVVAQRKIRINVLNMYGGL